MAGEIWHLSIEDLFQPVQEVPRLGGDGPFVINLSVSTAPISVPAKSFTHHANAHVYQIQVTEDGRPRFRLRLGPFATEDEVDAILAEVRETYPGALTATASGSDLRVIAGLQAKVEHRQSAAQKTADKAPANRVPANKADAEVSIDIAWPTPALIVPPKAPPARPVATVAPVVKKTPSPPPKLNASNFTAPLAIVNDAPLLTEVVMPVKKSAPKHKPLAAAPAPTLTDAVAPKIKTPAAPAAAAKKLASPPSVSVPVPVSVPAPLPAVAAPAPVVPVVPAQLVAAAMPPPKALPKPPTVSPAVAAPTPPAAPKPVASVPVAPKSVATPARVNAAPVLTQSIAARNPGAIKARGGITKPSAANKLTSLQHVVVATAPAPALREVKQLDEPLESLECTQTIRALTPKELEDNESRWFVIQLSLADHAFDPDSVPNLDLFSEYRLYSVAGLDQGRVVHALRLGFFREEIAAVAVASYLAAYWDKPTIKRVSVAERERFADQRVDARKDVGATGKHAVIEITDELVARRRRSSKAAAAHNIPPRPI
ncbi:MAG TPA: SPOR domain-containing protein [Steroidobacteraceae bacterium]|jgi:hypothetical protein|nr:SPOR domain-containing protein [Steroidobacteraceae bacterium]